MLCGVVVISGFICLVPVFVVTLLIRHFVDNVLRPCLRPDLANVVAGANAALVQRDDGDGYAKSIIMVQVIFQGNK